MYKHIDMYMYVCIIISSFLILGRVSRRTQRYEEAREKRLACEEAMEAVLPKLNGAESLVTAIKDGGLGKNSIKSLREQLEMMEVNTFAMHMWVYMYMYVYAYVHTVLSFNVVHVLLCMQKYRIKFEFSA